jgi:hypothetical protein
MAVGFAVRMSVIIAVFQDDASKLEHKMSRLIPLLYRKGAKGCHGSEEVL